MLLSSPRVPPVSIEEMAAIDAELGRRREPGRTPLNISARRAELIYRGRAAAPQLSAALQARATAPPPCRAAAPARTRRRGSRAPAARP